MKQNKDIFVGEIRQHLSQAGAHTRPTMRRTKLFVKGSPLVTVLLVASVGLAVLGGMYWSFLQVEISGTTTLHGKQISSVFEWDDTPIMGTLSLPVDVTDLYPGDNITTNHTIKNCDLGSWLISFNDSSLQSIYTNESDPYYGFSVIMIPDNFLLDPFETMNVTLCYRMHYEMMAPSLYNASDDFDYTVSVDIESVNPPVANPDIAGAHVGGTVYAMVLDNDLDYSGSGLLITSVSATTPASSMTPVITGTFPDQHINVGNCNAPGTWTFTYTIVDGYGLSDIGTVTITIYP